MNPLRFGLSALLAAALAACGAGPGPVPSPAATATVVSTVPSAPPPIGPEVRIDAPPPIEMGVPPAPGRYDGSIDVLRYDVELVIPPGNDRISSFTTVHYQSRTPGSHEVVLDLTGLEVTGVAWEGEPIDFSHRDGTISFTAPGSASASDTFVATVAARGFPTDGLILRNTVHGAPSAFGDNWPNRARFWFPSHDHPSDKASVTFTVHAPEGRSVVANGVLREGDPQPADTRRTGGVDGLLTWRWSTTVPIPTYLMVIGATEMVVMDGGLGACGRAPVSNRADGCVPVTAWAFPPDTAHARTVFSRSAAMLDYYAELIGPYPYEKLANVQSSTRFGGMENASAIFYSEQAIAQGRDIEGTVAHEIAHQWFGNSVTPADWPHLWLSEGFASYFGPLFWEHTEGTAAFLERIDGNRQRVLESEASFRPVVDHDAHNLLDLLNSNSYQKGSLVLHMLRGILGDDAFFEGVRSYYARHAGGNAVTDDLRRALEEAHGGSLEWFFQQWLHEPGFPAVRTSWRWDATAGEVELAVRQEQDSAWPAFRIPLELEFELPEGSERATRWVEGREWTGRIALPAEPRGLRLDPDGWLLLERLDD